MSSVPPVPKDAARGSIDVPGRDARLDALRKGGAKGGAAEMNHGGAAEMNRGA